jgi:ketosteroid isomerase-like protein
MTNRLFLLVALFLSYVNTDAQASKKDIESSIGALNNASISRDSLTLEKLTSRDLSYGHSTGLVENKAAYLKNILSGSTKFLQIDNADQTINLSGNIIIVRNICSIKGTKDGALLDIKIGVLMIWSKEGADWKLLARQGYKLP